MQLHCLSFQPYPAHANSLATALLAFFCSIVAFVGCGLGDLEGESILFIENKVKVITNKAKNIALNFKPTFFLP
jgi:hypothetical protein